jgi:hypothetical protein
MMATKISFPGYLFFELVEAWREVFRCDRILGALMWSPDEPARLSQDVMDELQERAGPDGVIKSQSRRKRRFNRSGTQSIGIYGYANRI